MALRLFCMNITATKNKVNILAGIACNANGNISRLLIPDLTQQCQQRPNTFFAKRPAEQLWKSVVSVSNAGKRRGRGKRGSKKVMKDLNKGQIIGVGKVKMVWPGLNSPILQGLHLVKQHKVSDESMLQSGSQEAQKELRPISRRIKIHPLERGWTSATMCGRSLGPPDPVRDQIFENFDTIVLENKLVNHMTKSLGRVRKFSCFAVTGNKNGLAGFALKKSTDAKSALKQVKNRAGQKVIFIKRYNNHTVYHNFFTQFGRTKIYVAQKPEGYGLVCHRVIKECCKMIGIKDLYAKVEGASSNAQNITKAFFLGLINQKTHQEIADEKKLHLVEFNQENYNYPTVVASPSQVRTKEEISPDEIMDFEQYVLDGKVRLAKQKKEPFYTKLYSWTIKRRKLEYLRNQRDVRLRMYVEHGMLRSFLTDKYPEAIPKFWKKVKTLQVEEEN